MMKPRNTIAVTVLAGLLFAGIAIAQQHENHPGGPPPAGATAGGGCCANMGSTPQADEKPMSGMSMDMSSCPHMQAGPLADQLLASFAELEKEKDMAALKLKLAAHGNLLKQLKTTTEQKCPMMENMGGGNSGGMGGGMMHEMGGMGGGMMGGSGGGMGGMQHNAPAK